MQDEGIKYNYSFKSKKFLPAKKHPFSQTEKLVIQHLSLGNSTQEIANLLSITENAVKYHKKNIFCKLDVKNSNEAVYLATIQK